MGFLKGRKKSLTKPLGSRGTHVAACFSGHELALVQRAVAAWREREPENLRINLHYLVKEALKLQCQFDDGLEHQVWTFSAVIPRDDRKVITVYVDGPLYLQVNFHAKNRALPVAQFGRLAVHNWLRWVEARENLSGTQFVSSSADLEREEFNPESFSYDPGVVSQQMGRFNVRLKHEELKQEEVKGNEEGPNGAD